MRIIFTGGGTAGHVIPNLAVIEGLKAKRKKLEILYIGSKDGIEKKLVEKESIDFKAIACGKLRRYFSWENFLDVLKVPIGIWQAAMIMRKFRPEFVFSKGGYVGLPVTVAASLLGVAVIVHESDVIPGLANKIAFRYADKICLSFEESKDYIKTYPSKVVVTGNPVREKIGEGSQEAGYKFTGLDKHRPVILVMGGSLGAVQINELVTISLDELLKKFQVVHLRGRGNLDISLKKKGYKQYEYLDEQMADVYAMADLIISRGGANSLAEIAFLGKKALIIPLGKAGSRGDQIENALVCCRKYGWAVLDGEIGREDFIKAIELAYKNRLRGEKFENGVKKIVNLILSL